MADELRPETVDELHARLCCEYADRTREASELRTAIAVIDRTRRTPTFAERLAEGSMRHASEKFGGVVSNGTMSDASTVTFHDSGVGCVAVGHGWAPEHLADDADLAGTLAADDRGKVDDEAPDDSTDFAADPEVMAVRVATFAPLVVRAVTALGRFAYREDIERELMRSGRDISDEMPAILKRLVRDGALARVRYNNSNRCVAYGLTGWLVDGEIPDDRTAQGKKIDPRTAEISGGE